MAGDEIMNMQWCKETATKAYIDAAIALARLAEIERGVLLEDAHVAELISAMAGGWRSQLVVEAWACGGGAATGLALEIATNHTRGRHASIVQDEQARVEYEDMQRAIGATGAEVVVGEAEDAMRKLEGADLVVVDCRRMDAERVLKSARPGPRGMVVMCMHSIGRPEVAKAMKPEMRVVRSVFLPVSAGMEILHVGVGKGPRPEDGCSRWIKLVDRNTGEEHLFRR